MSSKSAVTYNGKAQKPAVTVYAGNKKISGKYYTVSYKNNTAVGTAMITIQGKGNYKKYSGKTTFRINLQKTTLSSAKSSRKGQLQAMQDIRFSMRQMRNFLVPKQKIQK